MNIIKKNNNNEPLELKKHIATIHCHGKITLLQRKIANALLFHAYHHLATKDEHVIQISELTKLVGFDSHDHKKIKEALIALLSTVIEWNVIDEQGDDVDVWNASSMISDVSIKGSTCRYSYSNKMRKLLFHPLKYGKIDLSIQAKFQSSYGLTLYENCNRYHAIGITPWFDLITFRKLMGIEDNKYPIFRDLNSRVIKKAVEEVNLHTQLDVCAETKKENRQVVGIRFIIKNKNQKQIEDNIDSEPTDLINHLKNKFGLSAKQIKELQSDYGDEYIQTKIELVQNSESFKQGRIKNISRYLISAIVDDYQPQIQIEKPVKIEITKQIAEAYEYYKRDFYQNTFLNLPDDKQDIIKKAFTDYIQKSIYSKLFQNHGYDNTVIKDQFNIFLGRELRDCVPINIEQFAKSGKIEQTVC